jgi:hypothetical protein
MVRITDPERSRSFYEALGFTFAGDFDIVRDAQLEATNTSSRRRVRTPRLRTRQRRSRCRRKDRQCPRPALPPWCSSRIRRVAGFRESGHSERASLLDARSRARPSAGPP